MTQPKSDDVLRTITVYSVGEAVRYREARRTASKDGEAARVMTDNTAPRPCPDAELRPCPFCGRQPISFASGDGSGLMVECITPNCVNPHVSYILPEAAIAAWNTRADTLDRRVAAATGTAKTPQAVEGEASQSGPNDREGNAHND